MTTPFPVAEKQCTPPLQRHVARALWHLAASEESRVLLLEHGGVATLVRLAQAPEQRALQSKALAQVSLPMDDALSDRDGTGRLLTPLLACSKRSSGWWRTRACRSSCLMSCWPAFAVPSWRLLPRPQA